ncbi:MAG: hypothetical protein ACE5KJ_02780 [Candidatus Zixiibacteriota bacterium]
MPKQGNWELREGFKVEKVVSGLSLPVNLAFVPSPDKTKGSPLFYVTELYGTIKVVTNEFKVFVFADDLLNYQPDFMIPGTGESGVMGSRCMRMEMFLLPCFIRMVKHSRIKW